MKKALLTAILVAAVANFAAGQDSRIPQASLDREIHISQGASTIAIQKSAPAQIPPSYCRPCLFYAGDFDSNASDANGLANEKDILVSNGAAVYTPFIVPKGKTWTVTGLLTLNFMSNGTLHPAISPYEVRKNIPKSGGSGGDLVCHGKKPAIVRSAAMCSGFGYECYAVIVNQIEGCRLPSGKYWVSVVPYCTASGCSSWRAFITNDDGAMAHRYGPLEPVNDSFFYSEYLAYWEPTSEEQTSKRFSAGVEGTEK